MKKDPILKIIQTSKFIWSEAKKPVLRTKMKGKLTLLPNEGSDENGRPRLSYNLSLDLTLVYLLLGLLAVRGVCRAIRSLFKL